MGQLTINCEECIDCGACINACPTNAMSEMLEMCKNFACSSHCTAASDECTECGQCAEDCPFSFITVGLS